MNHSAHALTNHNQTNVEMSGLTQRKGIRRQVGIPRISEWFGQETVNYLPIKHFEVLDTGIFLTETLLANKIRKKKNKKTLE